MATHIDVTLKLRWKKNSQERTIDNRVKLRVCLALAEKSKKNGCDFYSCFLVDITNLIRYHTHLLGLDIILESHQCISKSTYACFHSTSLSSSSVAAATRERESFYQIWHKWLMCVCKKRVVSRTPHDITPAALVEATAAQVFCPGFFLHSVHNWLWAPHIFDHVVGSNFFSIFFSIKIYIDTAVSDLHLWSFWTHYKTL